MLGCVDGSLIRIKAPAEDENVYVCRKQYHVMSIQGICDHRKVFTNIVSRWPGSAHDAFIWSNCALNTQFENGEVDGHLVGDSAYPLRPWLLTPIQNAGGQAEERYNRSHRVTRQCMGGAFGIWKMRWLVIYDFGVAMTLRLAVCLRVIVATTVLHNICQLNGVPLPPDAPPNHGDNPDNDNNHPPRNLQHDGQRARDAIIRGHFAR